MKKILFYLASILILISLNSTQAMKFNDIEPGYWAYSAIDSVGKDMYAEGYPAGDFEPYNYITRAEYATMLVKAIGQTDCNVEGSYYFDDIDPSHWAYNYVIRAVDLGIFEVDGNYFYPNEYVARSEMITFLVNILKTEDITRKEALDALKASYDDYADIPDWFKVTAGKAEVLGVIAKEPPRQRYLDSDKNITRAQMAVFLYNLKKQLGVYLQEQIEKESSPTVVETGGITIENVTRNGDIVTLPIRTMLPITVSGQISSKYSVPGEMFRARFLSDLVDNKNNLLLSKDMILIGKILDTTKARVFLNNGEILFELSALNNNNLLTRIMGYAECETVIAESNKLMRAAKTIFKGKNFTLKDGQVVYIKLFKPLRINIVTHEILD